MRNFVSFDGTDANGVRAEVYVQAGKGTISEIKKTANGTADVKFSVDKLKFPIHGWIAINNPLFAEIEAAHASNQEVEFRLEAQRKAKVDRKIPIADLRTDATVARDNTIQILAGINGKLSDEAVTNPDEDPADTYGRIKATPADSKSSVTSSTPSQSSEEILQKLRVASKDNSLPDSVIASVAAAAVLAGATPEQVQQALGNVDRRDESQPESVQRAFSMEAPTWKSYNSDGRQNLGSTGIAAGVSVEHFVRAQLKDVAHNSLWNTERFEDAVLYFGELLLAIADRVQTNAYGQGFRSDRGATSHTRARGIVYDTVAQFYPLPINSNLEVTNDVTQIKEWVAGLGTLSVKRFESSVAIANSQRPLSALAAPASLLPAVMAPVVQPVVEKTEPVTNETLVEETPADVVEEEPVSTVEGNEPESEPEVKDAPVAQEETVSPEAPSISSPELEAEEPEVAPEELTEESTAMFFPQQLLDESLLAGGKLKSGAPSEETVSELKAFTEEAGVSKTDLKNVTKLLAWTFGPKFSKATNVPEDILGEFIDFYIASGTDNFNEVLKKVVTL